MAIEYVKDGPDKVTCPVCGEYPADFHAQSQGGEFVRVCCAYNVGHNNVTVEIGGYLMNLDGTPVRRPDRAAPQSSG